MDAANLNPLSFRLASAYGVAPRPAVRPVLGANAPAANPIAANPLAPAATTDRVDAALTRIRPLVAATVAGSIDFSASAPQQVAAGGAMPMYRHPYDKNAAATSIASGKAIDVTG
jgi:hypothetical protein